jgi:hypothetical protein
MGLQGTEAPAATSGRREWRALQRALQIARLENFTSRIAVSAMTWAPGCFASFPYSPRNTVSCPPIRSVLVLLCSIGLAACPIVPTEADVAGGKVTYFGYRAATCAASATPLPGFRTCSVIVAVQIAKPVSTGTVSVIFNYPDGGSFYRGQLSGLAGVTGTREITLNNAYVSSCPQIQSTVDIYDGPLSAQNAPLLQSISAKIGPMC